MMSRCDACGQEVGNTKTIGDLIRKYRRPNNITQAKLAKEMMVSRSSIATIETGRQALTIDQVKSYAKYLKIPKEELLAIIFEEVGSDG